MRGDIPQPHCCPLLGKNLNVIFNIQPVRKQYLYQPANGIVGKIAEFSRVGRWISQNRVFLNTKAKRFNNILEGKC